MASILQIEAITYRCKHEADLKIDCLLNIRHSTEVLCMKFSVVYSLVYVILYLYIFIYNGWVYKQRYGSGCFIILVSVLYEHGSFASSLLLYF